MGLLAPTKRTKLVCRVLILGVGTTYQRNGSAMWEPGADGPIVNDRYHLGMGNTIGLFYSLTLCLPFEFSGDSVDGTPVSICGRYSESRNSAFVTHYTVLARSALTHL